MKSLKYYILNCLASISLCLINFDTGKGLLENVIRFAAFARHRFIRAIDSAESREIMFDHKWVFKMFHRNRSLSGVHITAKIELQKRFRVDHPSFEMPLVEFPIIISFLLACRTKPEKIPPNLIKTSITFKNVTYFAVGAGRQSICITYHWIGQVCVTALIKCHNVRDCFCKATV